MFCFYRQPAVSSFLRKFDEWLITKNRERERKFHHRHFLPGYWLNRDMQERGEGVRAVGTAATILAWNKDALYCIICREHSCRSFGWTTNGPWTAQQRWQYRLDLAQMILTWGEKKTIISLRPLTDLTQASYVLLKMINFIECVIIFYWLFPYCFNTGYSAQFTCNQSLVLLLL